MNKNKLLILLIFLLAFLFRFYYMWGNPPSLSWDEVSIGYNAYSILKTGKDEHGRFLPLDTFTAYGDYKPPLAIYLTVPFVAIFGLNEFSIRLPSVLFGTGSVILTYFLVQELIFIFIKIPNNKLQISNNTKTRKSQYLNNLKIDNFGFVWDLEIGNWKLLPLICSILMAISPWHINLSRAGWEANISHFFLLIGIYLVLKAVSNYKIWLFVWIPFAAAIYTFNSSRYVAPFFGLSICIFFYQEIRKHFKYFIIGLVILFMLLLPVFPHLLSKEARLRFTEVNIFSDAAVVQTSNERIAADNGSIFSKIIHNRRVGYARSYLQHYFDHFRPEFLFVKGDGNPKFSTQDVGQLLFPDALFLVLGAFAVFHLSFKLGMFLLFWLLVSIIPAASARETPHALRIMNSLPVWQIFSAFGLLYIISSIKTSFRKMASILILVVYLGSFSYYLWGYYVHYPVEFASEWQYGYKQAFNYIRNNSKSYNHYFISDFIGRSYMYTLFFEKYDPNKFIEEKKSYFDAAGFYHVDGFGKYIFGGGSPDNYESGTLYIMQSNQVPTGAEIKEVIRYPNGDPVITIFEKS